MPRLRDRIKDTGKQFIGWGEEQIDKAVTKGKDVIEDVGRVVPIVNILNPDAKEDPFEDYKDQLEDTSWWEDILKDKEDLVGDIKGEREGWLQQLEDLRQGRREYEIPESIRDLQELYKISGSQLQDVYGRTAEGILETTEPGVERMLNYYRTGADKMVSAAEGGYDAAERALTGGWDTAMTSYEQTAQRALDEYRRSMGLATGAVEEGMEEYVGMAETAAGRTRMPGEETMRGRVGSSVAAGLRGIQETGGGSAASLGAIADLARNRQVALQDIEMQNLAYREAKEAELGSAYLTRAQMLGDVYGTQAQVLGGAEMAAGQMVSGAQERRAGDIAGLAERRGVGMADIYGTQAQLLGGAEAEATGMRTTAQLQAGELRGRGIAESADLAGRGFQAMADAQGQEYYYNQVMPYQMDYQFMAGMAQQYDPYSAEAGLLNDRLYMEQWQRDRELGLMGMEMEQETQRKQRVVEAYGMLAQTGIKALSGI